MCLMVWIGTARPLAAIEQPLEPGRAVDRYHVRPVAMDDGVCGHFSNAHVAFVGSHEGCGCGFNSDQMAFEGFTLVTEVLEWMGALTTTERDEFFAEQRSRERLAALVRAALADGPVEVYACQAGDEREPTARVERVPATWFASRVAPLSADVLYAVVSEAKV